VRETGDGPPVVLLHGWPHRFGMWDPVVEALSGDHRVLVPDLRGFGDSTDSPPGHGKHSLAADVIALLDHEDIGRATIVGHDWGGWIAWLLALERPDRVTRFAAIDVPPPYGRGLSVTRLPTQLVYGSYQAAIATPLIGRRLVQSRRAVARLVSRGAGDRGLSAFAREGYATDTARTEVADASVQLYRSFLLSELPRLVGGGYAPHDLRVPGLALMGAESPIRRLAGTPRPTAQLRVEVIEGAGHFLVDEAPEAVTQLLGEHLRGPRLRAA
jgi:pimeloyl-ACP methyl ester carboxylesterase